MRPTALDPFFASLSSLSGVGPKRVELFARLLGQADPAPRLLDLLFHLPHAVVDRRVRRRLTDAAPGETGTFAVTVDEHRRPPRERSRSPYRILCSDDGGADLLLVYFHGHTATLERTLPVGSRRYICGKLELWDGRLQMVHPDRVLDERGLSALPPFEPVYPLTEGLTSRIVGAAAGMALERVGDLPEWHGSQAIERHGFPSFRAALQVQHRPEAADIVDAASPSRRRLAFDELLAWQLALGLRRNRREVERRPPRRGDGKRLKALTASLPFSLTAAQIRAIEDIRHDFSADRKMVRLLQGDVGSGKTAVAAAAMTLARESGGQSCLMAPTELLARQHFARVAPLLEGAGLRTALLTGRERGKAREETLAGLAGARIDAVVGTHALLPEPVSFAGLSLAVIDEQHRFGVRQRLALASKGDAVDLLSMTATPIPRTLVLSLYGDIDVSVLDEKPPGRQPIDTRLVSAERLDEMIPAIGRAMAGGAQVYWVCPLVSESEDGAVSAESRFATLQRRFGTKVGLVHGQMPADRRDATMKRFIEGELRLLVATTVIEVGVDVASATIMVVEHAERFGLAQLHQLRGRVGRGDKPSSCFLLYRPPLGTVAEARLSMLRSTEDGFRIAEEDLRLRGEGELLGRKQSGLPGFVMARPEWDQDLLDEARAEAATLLADSLAASGQRGAALRMLLHLFGQEDSIRLLAAG